MLNTKNQKKFFMLGFGFLTLMFLGFSCSHEKGDENPILNSIYYNVKVSGKNVTLTNNLAAQTKGFSLTFSNVGNLKCNDVSIVTIGNYGFVPNGSTFIPSPVNTSMPQYTCTKTGSTIVLSSAPPLTEGFHPWVDNFNILIGKTIFNVNVDTTMFDDQLLTRGAQSAMNLSPSFSGCGLRGTILQRVFDCSKKIINYAVFVDATSSASGSSTTNLEGTSAYYTLFTGSQNPDLFWFVVACPNTKGLSTVPQQSCHWLTPVVPEGNPALDVGRGVPTFQLSMLTGYQKRLLFSGKMTNGGTGYNFDQANGFASSSTNEVYVATGTPGTNPGITPSNGKPVSILPSVCFAKTGQSLQSGGVFPSSDLNIRDIVSIDTGATIGDGASGWQVPSYAMYNILTGGTPTIGSGGSGCPVVGTGPAGGRPRCDMPTPANTNNQGFSAINVPGFSQTNVNPGTCSSSGACPETTWTSSSSQTNLGWSFFPISANNGGFVSGGTTTSFLMSVRCVARMWY